MVQYRLKFNYQDEDKLIKRENNINEILSEQFIISDTPIRKPLEGEIILISGQEYKVVNVILSFETEGDRTYYDFNVLLKRNIKYVPLPPTDSKDLDYKEYIKRHLGQGDYSQDQKYDKYKYDDYLKKKLYDR